MAQGKLKAKTKLPEGLKIKKHKGCVTKKRSNCPVKPKKKQHEETQKLKKMISKTVNKTIEEELRARSVGNPIKLSKAQEAVANHSKGNVKAC